MKKLILKTDIGSIEKKSTKNAQVIGFVAREGLYIQNFEVPNGEISYNKDSNELVIKVKMALGDYLLAMDAEGLVESKLI